MQQEIVNDIIQIIKNQKLDTVLSENDGIRRAYCQQILIRDSNFFIKAVNNNLYDFLKKFYILKKKVKEVEYLKEEEMEIIKKYIIYNNLKSLDGETLDKLRIANDVLQNQSLSNKIENNTEFRKKIISFIEENDKIFYNNYMKKNYDLNDKNVQIDMVKEYNDYLKKTS